MMTSVLLLFATFAATGPRQEVSLDGRWQHVLVDELTTPPAGAKWQPIAVPGYLHGIDYKRAWLRRSFDVADLPGRMRLKIRFGGVKYNSRIFVNGRRVGGCFGGYEPFEVDVTDAVRRGQPNELVVGVHDWTGVFTPGKVSLPSAGNPNKVRSMPHDKILAPIGGMFNLYGIWDSVTLVAQPERPCQQCVHQALRPPGRVGDRLHAGQRVGGGRGGKPFGRGGRRRARRPPLAAGESPDSGRQNGGRHPAASVEDAPLLVARRPLLVSAPQPAFQRRRAADAIWLSRILDPGERLLPERQEDDAAGHLLVAAPRAGFPRAHRQRLAGSQKRRLHRLPHAHPALAGDLL